MSWVLVIILLLIVYLIIEAFTKAQAQKKIIEKMTPDQKLNHENTLEEAKRSAEHGQINSSMVCTHCQSVGKIRTIAVKQKKGVSGGKATAALLTGGISLVAVGLSRKEGATQAHCDACKNTWCF